MTFTFKHKVELTHEELAVLMYNVGNITYKEMILAFNGKESEYHYYHNALMLKLQTLYKKSATGKSKPDNKAIWDAIHSVCGRS